MNAQTGRVYRGINVVLLAMESQRQGYALDRWLTYRQASELGGQVRRGSRALPSALDRWLTYRQASELGGQVRRGEQGSTVVFWRLKKLGVTVDSYPHEREDDVPERVIPLLRAYTVFNAAQVDGLPSKVHAMARPVWEPEARAEELLLVSGVTVHHGGPIACYRPAADDIQLPPRGRFPTAGSFYGTALHELTRATSHPKRCDRQLGKRFGDDAYAAEELIAEIGEAFLCAF
jgi:antirestriction protein ArdC